jgi:hypothetical protein
LWWSKNCVCCPWNFFTENMAFRSLYLGME